MKIFTSTEKMFTTNGLGQINPLKCIEIKKKSLNGWFIEVEVPSKYNDLIINDYIVCVETKEKGQQPFRIKNPQRNDRVISFTANHVVFDSERYLLDDVRPTDQIGVNFLKYLGDRTDTKCPFTFNSNVSIRKTKYFIRKTLLEALEETEKLFDAVFDVDGFEINMKTTVSNMSDETLVYGKNIQGMKKYEDWSAVCTKILPEGPDGLLLPEKYISADVQYELPYTKTVKFDIPSKKDDDTDKTETEMISELRELGKAYLNECKYPLLNYTVTSDINQHLQIGSIIPVKHPFATIETEVQEYRYDIILKKVRSITYGNYERDVKKAFGNIKDQISNIEKKNSNFLTEAKKDVYYLMNVAGKNGSIVFRKNEKGVIYEILAIDTSDIETAKTVMRFNNQGIAGSTTGINGEFNTAMMANGEIVADMIKVGTLMGIEININDVFTVDKTGKVKLNKGSINIADVFTVDEFGKVKLTKGSINIADVFNVDENGKVDIKKGSITLGSNFYVDQWGYLKAVNGEFEGTVTSTSGNKKVELRSGNMHITSGDEYIGSIGTNNIKGQEDKKGLVFDLETLGDYMSWSYKKNANDAFYTMVFTFVKTAITNMTTGALNMGCPLDMRNYAFKNIKAPDGYSGWTGVIPVITSIKNNSDGTITWYSSNIDVSNGIITAGPRNLSMNVLSLDEAGDIFSDQPIYKKDKDVFSESNRKEESE